MFFSRVMSAMNFTGVYFAFTGESNINVDAPACLIPSTIAHELSHQRGIASEQECNFLAVLASTNEEKITFLAVCGKQAIDGDTAQVGPQIAEKLHLPQVTYAADITKDGNTITVKRMLEDGYMTIKVKTPCLLTCIKELNEPRYMSIDGIYATYNKPLETFDYEKLKDHPLIDATTIGLKGSPTNVYKSFAPPVKGAGMMVEDAAQLVGILNDKHLI